jgi:hypothetical protein
MIKYLLGAVLLCGSGPALAVENHTTANDLMAGCRALYDDTGAKLSQERLVDAAECLGILVAVMRLMTCAADGVSYAQGARVLVAYLDARPTRLHERLPDLAKEALVAAWPCK